VKRAPPLKFHFFFCLPFSIKLRIFSFASILVNIGFGGNAGRGGAFLPLS